LGRVQDECPQPQTSETNLPLYNKAWLIFSISCDAPLNDLLLLQSMEYFIAIDKEVAKMALKKLKGQLCYLSQDLVALSLFSDRVNIAYM